jgi:prolyl-tRNA synthetase
MTTPSPQSAIQPTRDEDYPEWYQQVIKASDMAENSPVRGCMVIKPWGFALWENIVRIVDARLKAIGVRNAYFPIFIPLNFLEKEAQHVEGFAKECAVVTHHRLEKGADGGLVPAGELTEPLIVRPTSETIIGDSFSKWVKSYRDLPILINQWGNVVRWEMRTRIFLRTSEFLWHEGHTVHATAEEAMRLTQSILDIYVDLAENCLAMPVIAGKKSPAERFPGADDTLTIEAMMQDRKALQAGTSHFLGQNFARAQQIKYQDANEQEQFAWTTSWAVSTRLLGGLVMTHGDDDGVILPPRVASSHLVLLPVIRKAADQGPVMEYVDALARSLRAVDYHGQPLRVEVDARDTGGARNWDWIKKGIPLRIEIGPRDLAKDAVFFSRRDRDHRDKTAMRRAEFVAGVTGLLDDIQQTLHSRALAFQQANTRSIDTEEDFYDYFTPKRIERPEIHGGFALAHWCGDARCEEKIKSDLGVTIRCLPFDEDRFAPAPGKCIACGRQSPRRVIFAKSY